MFHGCLEVGLLDGTQALLKGLNLVCIPIEGRVASGGDAGTAIKVYQGGEALLSRGIHLVLMGFLMMFGVIVV